MSIPKIIIYTTEDCSHCIMLKDWLDENNLVYKEVDLTNNKSCRKTILKNVGYIAAPIVRIGRTYIVGNNQEKIRELLDINYVSHGGTEETREGEKG